MLRQQLARSLKDFKHDSCDDHITVAFDTTCDATTRAVSSCLFASQIFFKDGQRTIDVGIGENSRGVFVFAVVSNFMVVASKALTDSEDVLLCFTIDENSRRTQFPHQFSVQLHESPYAIVEATTYYLGADEFLHVEATMGVLLRNSKGTFLI